MILDTLRNALLLLAEASPYILFGLAVAGLLHVLLPERLVLRWMGQPGLSGVARAAAIGVPLPVCSCGVVPIAVELRRKGASVPSSQSFLITTPESSIDSIILTWGLMGPVMAIARPAAAFGTAVLGGVLTILAARSLDDLRSPVGASGACTTCGGHLPGGDQPDAEETYDPPSDHHHGHGHHRHGHDHDHDHDLLYARGDEARAALRALTRLGPEKRSEGDEEAPSANAGELLRDVRDEVVRPSLRYGFGDLLDDLAFWLVVGVLLAGLLTTLLPQDLAALGLGSGFAPMLLMLVVGIPIYMCASASTPIAAALLAKGVSPGAALVFLLAGPATNVATLALLLGTFGRRFVRIYLTSVVVGALLAGLLLDLLASGLAATLAAGSTAGEDLGPLALVSTAILLFVLGRSLVRGAWNRGVTEFVEGTRHMVGAFAGRVGLRRQRATRWAVGAVVVLLLAGWAATGLQVVPLDSRGFAFTFGKLSRADLEPGLHFHPPAPIGRLELRKVHYPRKADIGFRTDVTLLADRTRLRRGRDPEEWHSPLAAMNERPEQATFFTADETFVEMNFSVHYGLREASAFFFGLAHDVDLVALYAEAAARGLVASTPLDGLLTAERPEMERRIAQRLQRSLDGIGSGIRVDRVHIVDIHPPGDAVRAFRDVSTALEERATRIHRARQTSVGAIPIARGEAAKLVAGARGKATAEELLAESESAAFFGLAGVAGGAPSIVRRELRTAATERALDGRKKVVLPEGVSASKVVLWDTGPPLFDSSASRRRGEQEDIP